MDDSHGPPPVVCDFFVQGKVLQNGREGKFARPGTNETNKKQTQTHAYLEDHPG